MKSVPKCIAPWTSIGLFTPEDCKVCCWSKKKFKLSNADNLSSVWSSNEMTEMREDFLSDKLEKYCPEHCPVLQDDEFGNKYQKDLLGGETLDGNMNWQLNPGNPIYIRYFATSSCNIRCSHCTQDYSKEVRSLDFYAFPKHFKSLRTISIIGGEPLASKYTRTLIKMLNPIDYPECKFEMTTNGLLIDKYIQILHNRFRWIGVSVDGATKYTYEKIRKGASFQKLINNLELLSDLKTRDSLNISLVFTVMDSNYQELEPMYCLAETYGFELSVHPVYGENNNEQIKSKTKIESVIELLKSLDDNVSQKYATIKYYESALSNYIF